MAAPGTPLQVLIAELIMLMHLLIVLKLAPYQNDSEDWTSFVSSLTLFLATLGAFALQADDSSAPAFQSDVMGVLLIAISVLCIATELGIIVVIAGTDAVVVGVLHSTLEVQKVFVPLLLLRDLLVIR